MSHPIAFGPPIRWTFGAVLVLIFLAVATPVLSDLCLPSVTNAWCEIDEGTPGDGIAEVLLRISWACSSGTTVKCLYESHIALTNWKFPMGNCNKEETQSSNHVFQPGCGTNHTNTSIQNVTFTGIEFHSQCVSSFVKGVVRADKNGDGDTTDAGDLTVTTNAVYFTNP